jgi:hypothetical protein
MQSGRLAAAKIESQRTRVKAEGGEVAPEEALPAQGQDEPAGAKSMTGTGGECSSVAATATAAIGWRPAAAQPWRNPWP